MNAEVQVQFDRVEAALNTLVDSITSYNPSLPGAIALVTADDELSKSLEILSQHQRNYSIIQSLHATSAALDAQIESTLSLLAETRRDLLIATPIHSSPAQADTEPAHALEYAELLNYAQRIARFTIPPTRSRTQAAPALDANTSEQAGMSEIPGIKLEAPSPGPRPEQHNQQQQTNTPIHTPVPTASTPAAQAAHPSHLLPATDSRAVESLPEEVRRWLDPASSTIRYAPWPGEDVIRRGALARIQGMMESGLNPETVGMNGTSEDQRGDGGIARVEETIGTHETLKQRRTAVISRPTERERRESRDEGLLGFDLYNPDEE